jgi:hypothetical protein
MMQVCTVGQWKDRADRLGKTFEPVDHGDQNVADAPGFELVGSGCRSPAPAGGLLSGRSNRCGSRALSSYRAWPSAACRRTKPGSLSLARISRGVERPHRADLLAAVELRGGAFLVEARDLAGERRQVLGGIAGDEQRGVFPVPGQSRDAVEPFQGPPGSGMGFRPEAPAELHRPLSTTHSKGGQQ